MNHRGAGKLHRREVYIISNIGNHLGLIFLGDMGGRTWGHAGDLKLGGMGGSWGHAGEDHTEERFFSLGA